VVILNTVAVMGGEDWKMWMDALKAENLLFQVQQQVAYSI
jgi:enoyl-[acyl-carrier protein] reductase/trans-2-enoyl-CoA reductase (NAD+)